MATRKAEARRWYRQAWFDLQAARWNVKGEFYSTACFLAQQAAGKALKAMLYAGGAKKAAVLTHSLTAMIQTAGKQVPELLDHLESARQLDLHYVPSRYPNGLPDGIPHLFYGAETARAALEAADAFMDAIRQTCIARGNADLVEPESDIPA